MLDEDGFIVNKKKGRSLRDMLLSIPREKRDDYILSNEEIAALPVGTVVIFDDETYWDFFYAGFKVYGQNKYFEFEMSKWAELDKKKLAWVLSRFYLVSFNGNGYDIPITELALKDFVTLNGKMEKVTNALLKNASDEIIKFGLRPFEFKKRYGITIPRYNHIDLMPIAPLDASLKAYAARLHCPRLQDLPYPEDHRLTLEDTEIIKPYCFTDLDLTEILAGSMLKEIKLREDMSAEYGIDLRSKSDAQIAEAVICNELKNITGFYPTKPDLSHVSGVAFEVPDFIKFETPVLQKALEDIANAEFKLDQRGSPTWPEGLGIYEVAETGTKGKWVLKVKIGKMTYKLGMGGLHSTEKKVTHLATDEIELADNDVESFYPRIILNQRLFPSHLGDSFLYVYEKIVSRRLKAKLEKIKHIADSLKIVINGSFGKLGERFSRIYAPQLMLQVTITGQLSLLMLIERLEAIGIECVSGNTDGVISKYNKSRRQEVRDVIAQWEKDTNFKTEETKLLGVYSRDVNNYIALKDYAEPEASYLDEQLGFKTKGTYSERGSALNSVLSKNPEALICNDAVLHYLKNKTPIEDTIRNSKDINRFTSVRTVKGGAEKDGYYLGKVVRWYYPENERGCISYVLSGNKVPKTEGARPMMDLPDKLPTDIDYDYYVGRAEEMLYDIGVWKHPESFCLF